jgi:hypothetical protein
MPRKPAGIQPAGRERLRKNWNDIETDSPTPSWLTGGGLSEKGQQFQEQIDESNKEYTSLFDTKTVISIPEPDYYQGPELSTRVIKHRFVPNRMTGLTGTAYVQFGGTRKNGKKKTQEIYEYNDMPPSVYLDFLNTNSKGQTIEAWTRDYNYKKINDPSVFSL